MNSRKKGLDLDEGKVYEVWFIMECQCIEEDSSNWLFLSKVRKAWQTKAKRVLKKAAEFMAMTGCRIAGSALLTGMYAVWSAEQAFFQRGYKAYGGEFLAIPFVFWWTYAGLGWIACLVHGRTT